MAEKCIMLPGLGVVGKTGLLNELERLARAAEYHTIFITAHADKPLGPLVAPYFRPLLYDLDRIVGLGHKSIRSIEGWCCGHSSTQWSGLTTFTGHWLVTMGFLSTTRRSPPKRPKVINPMNRQTIHILFSEGMSTTAIAPKTGLSVSTVRRVRKEPLPQLNEIGAGLPILPGKAGERLLMAWMAWDR